jgi:cell division protein ZapA
VGQVTLKINGFSYLLGCPDGDEPSLVALGAELDRRIGAIKAQLGNLGEGRLLVIAAIQLADELADLKRELAAARTAPDGETAQALLGLARRLEGVANRLAEA